MDKTKQIIDKEYKARMDYEASTTIFGVSALELVEVLGEERKLDAEQVPEHGHVHGQASQTVSEVALWQHTLYQVDHHLH